MLKETKLIATHSGTFHADDVFATAVFRALFPDVKVVRTRDAAEIAKADVAIDVGGEWDPSQGRYDHHQKGFSGARPTGVVYASAGLVWADIGAAFVRKFAGHLDDEGVQLVQQAVDDQLVQYLDMCDTGAGNDAPAFYGLSALVHTFNITRLEEKSLAKFAGEAGLAHRMQQDIQLERFIDAVGHVQALVARLVLHLASEMGDLDIVRGAETLADGKILLLPESGLAWMKPVIDEMPDVLLVVYPESSGRDFHVSTVRVEPDSFVARLDLPSSWSGLRDQEFADVTGVSDAVFCHTGVFIAGARSKEGALRLAELALPCAC